MQKFTRTELSWIIRELESVTEQMEHTAKLKGTSCAEGALLKLKAENLSAITEKLYQSIRDGDKRIEVKT